MGHAQQVEKEAVQCGYWDLYRFNPQLAKEGKNPFSLDSKEPDMKGEKGTEKDPHISFRDFLLREVRYASLKKVDPEIAEELYAKTEQDAVDRRNSYVRLQTGYNEVK